MNETTINKKKDNSKVPFAVWCCFLIAFIVQCILKMNGIFVFEKTLNWQIFDTIDKNITLTIIYYSFTIMLVQYCLSFSFTGTLKPKKFYHYFLIVNSSFLVTIIRTKMIFTLSENMLMDILLYIVIPIVINITSNAENRLFKRDLFDIVATISVHIALYMFYLGLTYCSSMLASIIVIKPTWVSPSKAFLIYFELYWGLVTLKMTMNMLINKLKRRNVMIMPVNIASDEAKEKELEELAKKGK